MSQMDFRVVALIACFNRQAKTLGCLQCLEKAFSLAKIAPSCVVLDDGSTDGTAATVRDAFPWVHVIDGAGDLFWNRGMYEAWRCAHAEGFDAYLWVNDDVVLEADALKRALDCMAATRDKDGRPAIVVGSLRWPGTDRVAYGGVVRPNRWLRTRFRIVQPGTSATDCETMNGNFVLIPREVVDRVGLLDPAFEHGMGDFDYGLRARAAGCRVVAMPGFVGECSRNPVGGSFADLSLPRFKRFRKLLDRRFLPPRSWLHFTRRHGGVLWPAFWIWPYLRVLVGGR